LRNWGKRKNTSDGGFGRVFIGSRAVVDGRAVHNGGRDVAQFVAVSTSRASRDGDEDDNVSSSLSTRRGTWTCLGRAGLRLLGCPVGYCWAAVAGWGGQVNQVRFFFLFLFCLIFCFVFLFEFRFEFIV
jgi:hypothetical protein